MADVDAYPAAAIRGARALGRKARQAPARLALLAFIPAAGAVALAGGGAAPALAAGPAPACSAGTCTVSFTSSGTGQSFTVPAGVSSLSVTLYGAAGGGSSFGGLNAAGGDGALVTATLTVTPGEALGVDVGGTGANGTGQAAQLTAGGVNGGGTGFDSGGGGGATDITAGGTRLLVAGGGGGAGTAQPAFAGICAPGPGGTDPVPAPAAGGAGGNADSPGTAGQSVTGDVPVSTTFTGGGGGAPGTTSGPGAGGTFGTLVGGIGFTTCPGDGIDIGLRGANGSGAAGGNSAEDPNFDPVANVGSAGGGGGGGGYFGGGAGGIGAGEDGTFATTAGSGGGGGGASYTAGAGVSGASVSDPGNSGQVNGGNGEAVFSYADPVATGSPAYTVNQGQTLNVTAANGLLSAAAGTTQESGLTAAAASAATAQGGSVTVSADGSFGYTPAASFAGADSFGYTVTDASGDTASGTAVITVTAVSTSQKADVAVSLSCPSSLGAGQSGACTLTVVNHGPSAAGKLTAVLTLPANVTEVSCTGGCTSGRGAATWTASSLASGGSVSYQVTVKAAKPGKALLLGAAASRNPDPHLLNNVALATITVKH